MTPSNAMQRIDAGTSVMPKPVATRLRAVLILIPFLTLDYGDLALGSWICIIVAGVCFVSGLISMASAAIISTQAKLGAAAQSTARSPAR